MMVSFVLSFFPRDVLDEILNLIESVSEDFPSYSLILTSVSTYHLIKIEKLNFNRYNVYNGTRRKVLINSCSTSLPHSIKTLCQRKSEKLKFNIYATTKTHTDYCLCLVS